MDTISEIGKASKAISKGDDMREEMAMVMAPYANWEQFLTPAPMTIAVLGQLMITSTVADFSLTGNPPEGGFKLIKWPNSFQASLVQVSNSGYEAFNEAHGSMDKIRLQSSNIPKLFQEAVTIMVKGSEGEIKDFLPIPLRNIKDTADKCLTWSEKVKSKFDFVIDLTGELLEACVNAKGRYEEEYNEMRVIRQIQGEQKIIAEKQTKLAEEQYKKLEKSVQDAEKQHILALDGLPSGWEMIGMSMLESVANGVTNLVNVATLQWIKTPGQYAMEAMFWDDPASNALNVNEEKKHVISEQKAAVYQHASKIFCQVQILYTFINSTTVKIQSDDFEDERKVLFCEKWLEAIEKEVGDVKECEEKHTALGICMQGIHICKRIHKMAKDFQKDEKEALNVSKCISELLERATGFDAKAKLAMAANPFGTVPPKQSARKGFMSKPQSVVQQTTNNAYFKIEQATEHYKNLSEKFDKSSEVLTQSTKQLGDIMAKLAKCNVQEVNFDEIKETLVHGISALAKLRDEWWKLVGFFTMVSNLIECSLTTTMKRFIQYTETQRDSCLQGYPISSMMTDLIYQQTFEAVKIAHLVHMLSTSYVKISNEHLMSKIAGLGQLLSLNPRTDAMAITLAREKLYSGCEKAQEDIAELVKQEKQDFHAKLERRMTRIQTEFQAVLPPISDEIRGMIKTAVKQGAHDARKEEAAVNVEESAKREEAAANVDVEDYF